MISAAAPPLGRPHQTHRPRQSRDPSLPPAERERYKAPTLSLQCGGGAALMARKLGLTRSQGQRLVDLHHERYAIYWEWSDRQLQKAFDTGELVARDGWRCGVTSRTSIFTARNWLVQANSSAPVTAAC